jgi:hypothetical protein
VRQVTLKESEKKKETIGLVDPAAEPASTPALAPAVGGSSSSDAAAASGSRKTLAYVAVAAGGAGLVLGGVSGALALGKRGSLDDSASCKGDVCLPSQQAEVDSLDTLRTVSTIGFVAGGVLAATGVVLLLTAPPPAHAKSTSPRLALRLAPNGLSLTGAFQ